MLRMNVDDPATMARLLRSGAIWQYGGYWQKAFTALEKGLVPLAECKDVPPDIAKALAK